MRTCAVPRCAARVTWCTCRCSSATRWSATFTNRRPTRNGRSATTAPAKRPTAICRAAAARAQSCQDCHMPNRAADGTLLKSKIAGIQEYGIFPQAEHTLPAKDIDLESRIGFARHTLVGLTLFLTKMAQQFPDVLGIRGEDPMITKMGVDPRETTAQAILDQAKQRTADVKVVADTKDGVLTARVTVVNTTV